MDGSKVQSKSDSQQQGRNSGLKNRHQSLRSPVFIIGNSLRLSNQHFKILLRKNSIFSHSNSSGVHPPTLPLNASLQRSTTQMHTWRNMKNSSHYLVNLVATLKPSSQQSSFIPIQLTSQISALPLCGRSMYFLETFPSTFVDCPLRLQLTTWRTCLQYVFPFFCLGHSLHRSFPL